MTLQVAESVKPNNSLTASIFARCVNSSKRIRWEIDRDVIRGRDFDFAQKFLPDGLSLIKSFEFLKNEEAVHLSQIQGRTYVLMFGLVERFISAKVLETTRDYWLDDQVALEALVRFSDEELKHQELFRRIEAMIACGMPPGYKFAIDPNALAHAVLSKSTWAVMALILHIELFTQLHFQESISSDEQLSPLFKDVFLFHWREESQHAIIDEIEWRKHDALTTAEKRRQGVHEFIELIAALDHILQMQAKNDADYFCSVFTAPASTVNPLEIEAGLLKAYRWQYILSGAKHRHFVKVLQDLLPDEDLRMEISTMVDSLS
jgi:hypothetical protein